MGFSNFRTRVYATNERGLLDVLAFEVSWESMPQTNLRVQASPAVEVPGCTGASAAVSRVSGRLHGLRLESS